MELIQNILLVLSFAFSVFVIVFALNCLKRLGGRLKTVVIFLILAMSIGIARDVLSFFNILQTAYFIYTLRIIIIAFVFLAILNIAWMIKVIDGEYKNVLKREKQNGKKR